MEQRPDGASLRQNEPMLTEDHTTPRSLTGLKWKQSVGSYLGGSFNSGGGIRLRRHWASELPVLGAVLLKAALFPVRIGQQLGIEPAHTHTHTCARRNSFSKRYDPSGGHGPAHLGETHAELVAKPIPDRMLTSARAIQADGDNTHQTLPSAPPAQSTSDGDTARGDWGPGAARRAPSALDVRLGGGRGKHGASERPGALGGRGRAYQEGLVRELGVHRVEALAQAGTGGAGVLPVVGLNVLKLLVHKNVERRRGAGGTSSPAAL